MESTKLSSVMKKLRTYLKYRRDTVKLNFPGPIYECVTQFVYFLVCPLKKILNCYTFVENNLYLIRLFFYR